ncbi:MAG: ABC transporter substrate-binding protein [Acidimicrobiaceae bacterium]|nr:ABC transporter substrate-binding protein [Acidimicrobiaceae bacterium]
MRVVHGSRGRILYCVLAVLVLVLAACGNASSSHPSPGKSTDTVNWAEPVSNTPSWIWPFMPAASESNLNLTVQMMLFRPLYFFGGTGTATVDNALSLAQQPSYSDGGKTVTIRLKPYKWSNGEAVTAQDVIFFLNMMKAEPANWYDYTPGLLPDNIVSATAQGPTTLVLTTTKAYNPKFFLYNQLSQITPMPMAWDKVSATQSGDCATSVAGCAAVYNYLNGQSKDLSGYAANPLWQIVDGPWKLKSFSSDGHASFIPNHSYSGPVKPSLKQFNMLPFTSDTSEFNVLRSGKTIDVGYLPTTELTKPKPTNTSPATPGPNPLSGQGYTMAPWVLYGFSYFAINFNNPTTGPVFKQLYFRQALESLIDQPGILKSAAKGYGTETTGPIPLYPPSSNVSGVEKKDPYPFSVSKARQLLSAHGWAVNKGGTTTCAKPGSGSGECGAGVTQGQPLQFQMLYLSGNQVVTTAMDSLKSNASQVGMQITLKGEPFGTVISNINVCSGPSCTWDMGYWGGGWSYGPDYYPTGESLFATGASSNNGAYSDPRMDQLIDATLTSSDNAQFLAYENFAAQNLPVIWMPGYTHALTEIGGGLKGVTPQNPFNWLQPETWHY